MQGEPEPAGAPGGEGALPSDPDTLAALLHEAEQEAERIGVQLQLEGDKRSRWQEENLRRKTDFLPAIFQLLQVCCCGCRACRGGRGGGWGCKATCLDGKILLNTPNYSYTHSSTLLNTGWIAGPGGGAAAAAAGGPRGGGGQGEGGAAG